MSDATDPLDLAQQASRLAWDTASALRAGDLPSARRDCERALALAESHGSPRAAASVRTILGRVQLAQGQLAEARQTLERALDVHRAEHQDHNAALSLVELAACALADGDLDGAMEPLIRAATTFAREGNGTSEAEVQLHIARVHHAAGHLEAAQRHAEVALGASRRDESLEALAEATLARLHHERGQRQSALRRLARAIAIHHRIGDRRAELGCRLQQTRLLLERGGDVRDEAGQLVERIAPLGDAWLHGEALSLLGAALGAHGDRLAYTMLARADAALAGHPLRRFLPPIDQGWLDLARGDRDAAFQRFGAVPAVALRDVPLRLALGGLRARLAEPPEVPITSM